MDILKRNIYYGCLTNILRIILNIYKQLKKLYNCNEINIHFFCH